MSCLENGWILRRDREDLGEVIGYCENCAREIYERENFAKLDGELYCEDCVEAAYEVAGEDYDDCE